MIFKEFKRREAALDKITNRVEKSEVWDRYAIRIKNGFTIRIAKARELEKRIKTAHPSKNIIEALASGAPTENRRQYADRKNRSYFSISAAVNSNNLRAQHLVLESIADPVDLDLVSLLAVGFVNYEYSGGLNDFEGVPDDEFSIIAESMSRFSPERLESGNYIRNLREMSGDFIVELFSIFDSHFLPATTSAAVTFAPVAERSLELFSKFKRETLDIAGPDIATVFQLISDPTARPSKEKFAAMRELADDWGVTQAFDSLLFARILGDCPAGKSFILEKILPTMLSSRNRAAPDLEILLDKPVTPHLSRRTLRMTYIQRQLAITSRLKFAIDRGNAASIFDCVVRVFCFDRGIIKFLDWPRITAAIRRYFVVTPQSTFVTMLLSRADIKRLHPRASLSMGKGAFIGDLTALLASGSGQRQGLNRLLGLIKGLPVQAATALTFAVLDRSIIERLAAALTPRSGWLNDFTPGESAQISMLRISALRDAGVRRLISDAAVAKEIESEVELMRFNYFQSRMRIGRVRIPWTEIKAATRTIVNQTAPIELVESLVSQEIRREVIPRLVKFLTDSITDHILYNAPVSIDHALSNNLRHGIVVPRFLRAFDDALQTVMRRRTLSVWDEKELRQIFHDDSEFILRYREFVSDEIKIFVEEQLTVSPAGQLDPKIRQEISTKISQYFEGDTSKKGRRLETNVAKTAEKLIKGALVGAGRKLNEEKRKALFTEFKAVRKSTKNTTNSTTKDFLDSLETNLHEALEEVRQWIGVSDEEGDAIAFKISEVIKLELLTTHLNEWKKLKVTSEEVFVKSDGSTVSKFSIEGKYLELFEAVIHNLASNAFAHSGDGLKTNLKFIFKLEQDKIFIRAENLISQLKIEDVIAGHRNTVALSRKQIGPEARQDKKSGFQKIRASFAQVFDAEPTINIPPPSDKNRLFVVEITVSPIPRLTYDA